MKQAKKRTSPTITKLFSSARSARHAVVKACAAVSSTDKRLRRREQRYARIRESLEQMLASFDPKRHSGEAMAFSPAGREVLAANEPDDGPPTTAGLPRMRKTAKRYEP